MERSLAWGMDGVNLVAGEGSDDVIVTVWCCRVLCLCLRRLLRRAGGARTQWLAALCEIG